MHLSFLSFPSPNTQQMLFNRWTKGKEDLLRGSRDNRRPYLATECKDLNAADKWRQEILREIGKKVMDIQNAALGEHRLRDLNDEINKLIREKGHWERRIVELGGPNYFRMGAKITDGDGVDLTGDGGNGRGGGYRYFGAAKTLPGVRELFEKQLPRTVRRTRHAMNKTIDADYYGFRDEEDGVLLDMESEAEKVRVEQSVARWKRGEEERAAAEKSTRGRGGRGGDGDDDDDSHQFIAHVPLPDTKDIENLLVQKKKKELLAKYMSIELAAAENEAKEMLNKKRKTHDED